MALFQAPRGTSDILPGEQPYWRYVEEHATATAQLYGFQRIDIPTFEETSLFVRSVGEVTDIVEKEMYSFEDKGGVSLTLRPEGTASVCRAYLQHGMGNWPQPVRLYYFASIFRYDRPQAGRYREHHQFGYEVIGEEDPAVDAEVIDMAQHFYQRLGLTDLSLQLNSIGCPECRKHYIAALVAYYEPYGAQLCRDCQGRLARNPLRLLDCKVEQCQVYAANAPRMIDYLCGPCRKHFEKLQDYLHLLDVPYELNPRLVRGLDYYTRTVFEFQPADLGAQSTIGGGGRYDGLIQQLGGKPTPGIGFATGMERIILNLKKLGVVVPANPRPVVYAAHLGDEARDASLRLLAALREAGISAITAVGGRSLKAQLRQANAFGVIFVLIMGEEELAKGEVTVRDLARSEQWTVPVGDVVAKLGESLQSRIHMV